MTIHCRSGRSLTYIIYEDGTLYRMPEEQGYVGAMPQIHMGYFGSKDRIRALFEEVLAAAESAQEELKPENSAKEEKI